MRNLYYLGNQAGIFFGGVLKQIQEISWELYDLINHASGIWAFMGISYGIMEMKITKYRKGVNQCKWVISYFSYVLASIWGVGFVHWDM